MMQEWEVLDDDEVDQLKQDNEQFVVPVQKGNLTTAGILEAGMQWDEALEVYKGGEININLYESITRIKV